MTETTAQFVKRMIGTKRYLYSDSLWMVGQSQRCDHSLALSIFMAIKDLCVYKKLSGQEPDTMANGQEVRESVTGETNSFAIYWLQKVDVKRAIDLLKCAGLVKESFRNSPPYGYGDDHEFYLTVLSTTIISEGKTNENIKQAVLNILAESNRASNLDARRSRL